MSFINYDGLICLGEEALLTISTRAFRAGEGLIETMLYKHSQIRSFDLHFARLDSSLEYLGFPLIKKIQLQQEIEKTLTANNDPGPAMVRAQFFQDQLDDELHFTIECMPYAQHFLSWPEQGLRLGIAQATVKCYDNISRLKTSSRMTYSIAAAEALAHQWDDALLLNPHGRAVESTHSNIFAMMGNTLYTPPLSEGCIEGVMRKHLLQSLPAKGFRMEEKPLDLETLQQSDSIFLANAVRGIQPVQHFNSKVYSIAAIRPIFDWIVNHDR